MKDDQGRMEDKSASRLTLSLRTISFVLVVIGILISGYLSYVKIADKEAVCVAGGSFDCEVVQNSKYSEMLGVPVVYLGLATYLVIGGLLFLEDRVELLRDTGLLLLFGLVLFAFLYSMYLVYLQGAVLGAWCQWCLGHEATMTVLFVVTSIRLYHFLIVEPAYGT